MKREEIIEELEWDEHIETNPKKKEAYSMAIKSLEQELCEDAISREDFKNWIKELRMQLEPKNYQTLREYHIADNMLLNIYQLSNYLPSVTPAQKLYIDKQRGFQAQSISDMREVEEWK